jgi:hypothetical protein
MEGLFNRLLGVTVGTSGKCRPSREDFVSIAEMGSIGEFLGSIAVLVSLVYLAIQVKRNTETARTSTYQSIVSEFSSLNHAMAGTPDLSILFVNAMENFATLRIEEKARMSQIFFVLFHNFENMFYQHYKGFLDDEVWIGWKRLMLTYHARPGFQTWWSVRSDTFSPLFVEFLRTEKIDKAIASYRDVTELQA